MPGAGRAALERFHYHRINNSMDVSFSDLHSALPFSSDREASGPPNLNRAIMLLDRLRAHAGPPPFFHSTKTVIHGGIEWMVGIFCTTRAGYGDRTYIGMPGLTARIYNNQLYGVPTPPDTLVHGSLCASTRRPKKEPPSSTSADTIDSSGRVTCPSLPSGSSHKTCNTPWFSSPRNLSRPPLS